MKRDLSISFVVSNNEKETIKKNAKSQNKSMSAFIRERAIKPEMTNNELADMLMDYMAKRLESTKTKGIERIREESLKPPPKLSAVLGEMNEEQQSKFKESVKQTTNGLKAITKELEEIFIKKGLKTKND